MSELNDQHPSTSDMAEYAEGRLDDVRAIEAHLNSCDDCAQSILIARSVRYRAESGLIQPLTSIEVQNQKDRLRKLFVLQRGGGASDSPVNPSGPASSTKSGPSGWPILGALAGGLGAVSITSHGPKPILAGNDEPQPTPDDSAKNESNEENSSESGVTHTDAEASSHQNEAETNPDDVADLLSRIDELLYVQSDASPSNDQVGHQLSDENIDARTGFLDHPNLNDELYKLDEVSPFKDELSVDPSNDQDAVRDQSDDDNFDDDLDA